MRLASAALVISTLPLGAFAAADAGLATADQQSVETRALQIVSRPEVKEQIETSSRAFASLPLASDPEAQRALRPAVEELAFAALDAADSDLGTAQGRLGIHGAAHVASGHAVPVPVGASTNPDNVYRLDSRRRQINIRNQCPLPCAWADSIQLPRL